MEETLQDPHGSALEFAPDVSPVGLDQRRRDATVFATCTGTLISPRLVITAAHCVTGGGGVPRDLPIRVVWFGPGGQSAPGSVRTRVIACYRHPNYADVFDFGIGRSGVRTPDTPPYVPCGLPVSSITTRIRHDLAILVLQERMEHPWTWRYPVVPARPSFAFVLPGTPIRYAGFSGVGTGTFAVRPFLVTTIENYYDASNAWWEGTLFSGGDYFNRGDSGGPGFLGDPASGPLELISVISGSPNDDFEQAFINRSWSAPLSHPGNAAWVRRFLEAPIDQPGRIDVPMWAGDWDLPAHTMPTYWLPAYNALRPLDPDGDGLIGAHDNCPYIFNPDQRDYGVGTSPTWPLNPSWPRADGVPDDLVTCTDPTGATRTIDCFDPSADADRDGAPDVCDNCLPVDCPRAVCDPFNPDQNDADGDGVGDPCDFPPDGDRDGVADAIDNCPSATPSDQRNSNLLAEVASGAEIRGDLCDSTPVPRLDLSTRSTPSGPGTASTTVGQLTILGHAGAPDDTGGDPDYRSWQRTGFRFCPCDFATRDAFGAQQACQWRARCDVNYDRYFGAGPFAPTRWFPMSLTHDGTSPEYGPTHEVVARYLDQIPRRPVPYELQATWDFLADYRANGLTIVESTFAGVHFAEVGAMVWTMSRGEVSSAERLARGDLRSDVLPSPDCSDAGCLALVRNINTRSSYWAGSLRHSDGVPTYEPPPRDTRFISPYVGSGSFCPECLFQFPLPFFSRQCDGGAAICVRAPIAGGEEIELDGSFIELDPDVAARFVEADVEWIAVGVPEQWSGGSEPRLIGVEPDGTVHALVGLTGPGLLQQRAQSDRALAGGPSGGAPPEHCARDHSGRGRGGRDCGLPDPAAASTLRRRAGALTLMESRLAMVPGYSAARTSRLELRRDGYLWHFEGTSPEDGQSVFWKIHLPSGMVRRVAFVGPTVPGDVLAAALDASGSRAVVVDRAGAELRVFVVELATGEAVVVQSRPFPEPWKSGGFELEQVEDGTFLLAVSTPALAEHCLLLFSVSSSGVYVDVGHAHGSGELAGSFAIGPRGITLYRRGDPNTAVGVPWSAFLEFTPQDDPFDPLDPPP